LDSDIGSGELTRDLEWSVIEREIAGQWEEVSDNATHPAQVNVNFCWNCVQHHYPMSVDDRRSPTQGDPMRYRVCVLNDSGKACSDPAQLWHDVPPIQAHTDPPPKPPTPTVTYVVPAGGPHGRAQIAGDYPDTLVPGTNSTTLPGRPLSSDHRWSIIQKWTNNTWARVDENQIFPAQYVGCQTCRGWPKMVDNQPGPSLSDPLRFRVCVSNLAGETCSESGQAWVNVAVKPTFPPTAPAAPTLKYFAAARGAPAADGGRVQISGSYPDSLPPGATSNAAGLWSTIETFMLGRWIHQDERLFCGGSYPPCSANLQWPKALVHAQPPSASNVYRFRVCVANSAGKACSPPSELAGPQNAAPKPAPQPPPR
jgi:hypothetical protein